MKRATLAVALGIVCASLVRGDEAEDKAAKWVEGIGGKVTRDEKQPGKPVVEVSVRLDGKAMSEITALRHLVRLSIVGADLSPGAGKELAGLSNLTHLRLTVSRIDPAGLKHLATLPKLEDLDLSVCSLDDDAVAALAGVRGLKRLDLQFSNSLTGRGFENWADTKSLRELNLSSTRIDPTGMRHVARFSHLEILNVSRSFLKAECAKEIAKFTRLRELDITSSDLMDEDLKTLAGLKELRKLNLSNTFMTAAAVKELAPYARLEDLTLNPAADDTSIPGLAALKALTTLSLGGTNVTDAGLKELAKLPLHSLDLRGAKVTDAGVKELATFTHLRQLGVSVSVDPKTVPPNPLSGSARPAAPSITEAGLKELISFKKLEHLTVYGAMTEQVLAHVGAMKHLRSLTLPPNTLPAPAREAIQKALPDCKITYE